MSSSSMIAEMRADAFTIHHASVRGGTDIAFIREGVGGLPILLLHGWPGTKRLYYRNVAALARAGFEVVVPDASGWGDSAIREGDYADFTSSAHDFVALMESLGHTRFVLGAFDFGSVSALHLLSRFQERVIRVILWNAAVPNIPEHYAPFGLDGDPLAENEEKSHHIRDHGSDTDAFVARFHSDQQRIDYVKSCFLGRVWKEGGPFISSTYPGNFDDASAHFQSEPFGDPRRFRASLNYYTAFFHPELCFEPPLLDRPIAQDTLFLYGIADEMMGLKSTRRAEIAFANLTGPYLIDRAGHFLSWERPDIWNRAVIDYCKDLLPSR